MQGWPQEGRAGLRKEGHHGYEEGRETDSHPREPMGKTDPHNIWL